MWWKARAQSLFASKPVTLLKLKTPKAASLVKSYAPIPAGGSILA
jgi:hypothetical protein